MQSPDSDPRPICQLGMWDDERRRPWLSAAVLALWLGLVYLLGEIWPWGFAQ